jgi:hypothetical protein
MDWRHLAAEVGTYKMGGGGVSGLHNKPIGCSASGAYARGPDDEEEEKGSILPVKEYWPFQIGIIM